jgi:hypothetical protein
MHMVGFPPLRVVPLLVLLVAGSLSCGCSTRRVLTVDTRPSGARVWIDGILQDKPTPVDIEFVHARRFELRFEKAGYRSVATEYTVASTLADIPVVDLFFEATIRERRHRHVVDLAPLDAAPDDADVDAVMQRARAFRARTLREVEAADPPERILPSTGIVP